MGLIMKSLAAGGRCAVVVPEGLLFGSTGAHVELRRKLIDEFELLAIVSLPAGVFKPYAGVKTGVMVFRKPFDEAAKKTDKVWFYEVRADGFDPDKITGGGRPETPERNDIPNLLEQWREYKTSGFKQPPGVAANTMLDAGSAEPRSWWANLEAIAANDYNLAAGRYQPQINADALNEEPDELVRETLAIERDIVSGLEKLLGDLEAAV